MMLSVAGPPISHLAAVPLEPGVVLVSLAAHGIGHLTREAEGRWEGLRVVAEDETEVDVEQVARRQHHDVVQMPVTDACANTRAHRAQINGMCESRRLGLRFWCGRKRYGATYLGCR